MQRSCCRSGAPGVGAQLANVIVLTARLDEELNAIEGRVDRIEQA